ncbi:MAG: hypothetical protein LBP91_02140 [Coriobacteriales bacterium]|nr:hypothetical protein [Coriobacteriales bacterium]
MKKLVTILLILMFAVLCASCGSPPPLPPTDEDEVLNADDWWVDYVWSLKATIQQKEEFGTLASLPGMYADYYYGIKMNGAYSDSASGYPVEGPYVLTVESVITINTDEAAAHLLGGLGLSGEDLAINAELAGVYINAIPYYVDNNGFPIVPEYDQNTWEPILPEGAQLETPGLANIHKIAANWQSPIKDKNGRAVQPPRGSYLMFDSFKMEYTGSTTSLFGSFGEAVPYDVLLFVVIEPSGRGMDIGDYQAKVYLNLTTTEHHSVWLEGEGTLVLEQQIGPARNN